MRRRISVITFLFSVLAYDFVAAQAAARFEVASVKRNLSGAPSSNASTAVIAVLPSGEFRVSNTTLGAMIPYVYRVRDDQVQGVDGWMQRDRFDIIARPGTNTDRDQVLRMAQSLLEERFRLVLRRDQREENTYVLTVARADGKLGSGLQRADENDCIARLKAGEIMLPKRSTVPLPPNASRAAGRCKSIEALGADLARTFRTTVTDKSGLSGLWDYEYIFEKTMAPATPRDPVSPSEVLPSVFGALQEQLGLRLEQQRGVVERLVVVFAQPPTDN